MTLACTVNSTGITAPSYEEILAALIESFRAIYGADVYLDPSTQDFQFLAIIALAMNDVNSATIAAYNSFSPATAQGAGLSSSVKINGLTRLAPSQSTVDVTLTGTAGTVINNGVVSDQFGNQWALPNPVTIELSGSVVVTATAIEAGAIQAAPGTVVEIVTPTRGWVSVTNVLAAVAGAPSETDAALRQRQAVSTSSPAISVNGSVYGGVANLPGVQRLKLFENDTDTTNSEGLPGHSISLVVEGGDAQAIANTINLRKTPGTATYGTTSEVVEDEAGVIKTINFFRPIAVPIAIEIDIEALPGFVSTTGALIQLALVDYNDKGDIGLDVYLSKYVAAADLPGNPLSSTFNITALRAAIKPGTPGTADLAIPFNKIATLDLADIDMTVT